MNQSEVDICPGGREAIAAMLAKRFGRNVRLVHDPHGAPELVGAEMNISISHSRHYAAIMLHPSRRCGIDIEELRPEQLQRISRRFLTEEEQTRYAAPEGLLQAWTAKEAVFKAAGEPTLVIGQICLLSPDEAEIPDGRRFELRTLQLPEYTLTIALPK